MNNAAARTNGFHEKAVIRILLVLTIMLVVHQPPASRAEACDTASGSRGNGQHESREATRATDVRLVPLGQDAFNPDINYRLGMAAFENGDYETAVAVFERGHLDGSYAAGAQQDSDMSSSRLGYQEDAERSSKELISVHPMANEKLNIEQYLKAIKESRKEHFFSAKIRLGVDLDENAEPSPSSSDMELNTSLGDIVSVTVDRPEKDQSYTSLAGFNYLYRPLGSRIAWKCSGTNYISVYRHDEELDVNLYDFKAGASFARDRLTWDVYATANHLSLDYSRYLQTFGAASTVSVRVTPSFQLSIDGRFKKKNYAQDDARDAKNVSVALSPKVAFGRNSISVSVGWEYEKAEEDINTFSKFNGTATYELRLPYSTSAYVSYWLQETEYGDIYPLLGRKRDDMVQYVTTGFSKSISVWKNLARNHGMDLNMSYIYTRSESSDDLYSYTKNIASAGMSVVF